MATPTGETKLTLLLLNGGSCQAIDVCKYCGSPFVATPKGICPDCLKLKEIIKHAREKRFATVVTTR